MSIAKVKEIAGGALDWAVAKAKGYTPGFSSVDVNGDRTYPYCIIDDWKSHPELTGSHFSPTTDMNIGLQIWTAAEVDTAKVGIHTWRARSSTGDKHEVYDTDLPTVALRCFVIKRLGYEIDIPKELLLESTTSEVSLNGSEADELIPSQTQLADELYLHAARLTRTHTVFVALGKTGNVLGYGFDRGYVKQYGGKVKKLGKDLYKTLAEPLQDGQENAPGVKVLDAAVRPEQNVAEPVLPADIPGVGGIESSTRAIYLWRGFTRDEDATGFEVGCDGGHIAVVEKIAHFAGIVDSAVQQADQLGFEHDGPFDYEVTEPLGVWLRGQVHPVVSEPAFRVELTRRMETYFQRDCAPIAQFLLPVLHGVSPKLAAAESPAKRGDESLSL